ncbi:MAG: hypothetical protein IPP07_12510 [Holophagales bacterium]|nr:hypothetical protein [Holophagales bacterium]MBK9965674.1 hypothetical protein [Holophagales bacterium]
MRSLIASRVRDPAYADDLLQEVFLRVHRSGGTLERTDRLPAWLYPSGCQRRDLEPGCRS